jgi:predicted 3-demethylubiquinone-9 3-methyltransferase (glyoxalase superfamily)
MVATSSPGRSSSTVPLVLPDLLGDADPVKAGRVMKVTLKMKKLDIATLKAAYAG